MINVFSNKMDYEMRIKLRKTPGIFLFTSETSDLKFVQE